jgi:uncharacterized protein involved in outer membrane biogenesis
MIMRSGIRRFLTSKFFLISVGALLLFTLAGFILAPNMIRWYVPKYTQDQLKCQASMGKVLLNPFLLRFEVNDFSLNGPDGVPLVSFAKLYLDCDMTGFFHWAIHFQDIRLEKPLVNLVVEPDGSLNFAALAPKSSEEKPKTSESRPLGFILGTMAITGGEVTVTDRRQVTPATLNFQNLDLELRTLTTLVEKNGSYSMEAGTSDGETIAWHGQLSLMPFHSNGKIVFSGIRTASLWKFLQHSVNLEEPKGLLGISTDYQLSAAQIPLHLTLENFRADLSGVALKLTSAETPFFELNRFDINSAHFDLASRKLQIKRFLVDGGVLHVGIDEAGQSNLEKVMRSKLRVEEKETGSAVSEAGAQPPPSEEPPWTVNVEAFEIKDMACDLEDLSRSLPMAAGISNISISSRAAIKAGAQTQVTVKDIVTEFKGVQFGIKAAPIPLFAAQRFVLEGGDVDLGAKALTIARINISDGHIDVGRNRDGKINWEQLFARKIGTLEQAVSKPDSGHPSPWKFLLKSFELDDFRSEVVDQTVLAEKPLNQLRDLKVRLSEVDGKSPMKFEVGFGLERGGKVALRGKVNPVPPSVEANINLTGVDLTALQPFLEPFITLTLDSAAVSTDGIFRYGQPGGGSKLSYEGSLGVEKLSLNQPGSKETYLGWGAMKISKIKLAIEPNRLQIDEIRLSKPVAEVIIAEDRTLNLAKIVKEQSIAGGAETPTKLQLKDATPKNPARNTAQHAGSGDPFPFSIGKIKIEDGNMVFADLSLKPEFMTRVHALKGTVGRLSSEKKSLSEIQLDGRVDQYGMVNISGALDINDFKQSTDITITFSNVEMANISPYSGRFAGRRIESGKLSLDLKYQIQTNKLVGDNKIIVDNLVLGEKVDSPDAVNLPLDLAVALLSDSNGRIDLGLPVSGELDDPQFSIGPIIWKAFVNIITKAVTAPFRALGSLFGSGAEKFNAVEFDPGKADILPPEKEKLKKVAEVLQKRPQLKLVVQGQYSPEIDGLELKQINVSRAVAVRMGVQPKPDAELEPIDFSDSKVRGALEKLFAERFGPKAIDELERAVKKGEIKPRATQEETGVNKNKRKGFARLWNSIKLYKIVPGAMSPEQSDLQAGEMFARLVESDPNPDEALSQLAVNRAQAITAELQNAKAVPADRLHIADVQPLADEAGVSAELFLDSVATGN